MTNNKNNKVVAGDAVLQEIEMAYHSIDAKVKKPV